VGAGAGGVKEMGWGRGGEGRERMGLKSVGERLEERRLQDTKDRGVPRTRELGGKPEKEREPGLAEKQIQEIQAAEQSPRKLD